MPGPTSISTAEVDWLSVRLCVQSGLAANGWTGNYAVPVKLARNGFPAPEAITLPSVHVAPPPSDVAGIELGSHGKSRDFKLYIFGDNDQQQMRLAEEITNLFRDDQVKILAFVSGSETSPAAVGRYAVDEVGWRPIPMPAQATKVDQHRATVSAALRRVDA